MAEVVIACEELLTNSNKDPNFQMQYLVKSKLQRLTPMKELIALLKDKGLVANAAVNVNNNGNCKNPECNLKGPSRHVPPECWIKFLDKMPQRMKDSKPKSSPNGKFNTNSTNQSKQNADKWKNSPSMFKKETAKAMVTFCQSGEFTNEELNQTQNIVDAMALFSVKGATGAKRRNYNKLRKSLAGHVQKGTRESTVHTDY